MSDNNAEITQWLASFGLQHAEYDDDVWDPGFEAERRIVHLRLGLFDKLYLRPKNFKPHFYHKIYSLEIANWPLVIHTQLYDGFCQIETNVDIRLQATAQYAIANREFLSNINDHIKSAYEGLIRDAINKELSALQDGAWIESGLNETEKKIIKTINELLILQNVQCRTFCSLKPAFEEKSEDIRLDGRFAQESVYLNILKKNFEFKEKQQQEKFRQEQAIEEQKLLVKQMQLQQLNKEDEIERLKAIQQAENQHLILKDKEKLQREQFEIEKRLHAEKINNEQLLKEMAWLAEHQVEESLHAQQRLAEKQNQEEKLAHESYLKEQTLAMEIQEYEKQQASWNQVKARTHLENLKHAQHLKELDLQAELSQQAALQQERKAMMEQLLLDKINNEANLKEIELRAQVEEKQKRFDATQNLDQYLRREIELLILERQRAELSNQVKQAENKNI